MGLNADYRGTLDTRDPLSVNAFCKDLKVMIYNYAGTGHSGGPVATPLGE
jgi:hypothetical protein